SREFGDIVSVRFGPHPVYLLSHPDQIEEVLVAKSRFFIKHYVLRLNNLILGNGLLNSEGDFWLRQRRLMQPIFHRNPIAGYAKVIIHYAEILLEEWRDGEMRDVHVDMGRITLQIAAKTLFDADVAEEAREVKEALEEGLRCHDIRLSSFYPLPTW